MFPPSIYILLMPSPFEITSFASLASVPPLPLASLAFARCEKAREATGEARVAKEDKDKEETLDQEQSIPSRAFCCM